MAEDYKIQELSIRDVNRELLFAHYSIRASRSLNWTSLMNQTPATAMTGLAFLLMIALDSNSTAAARIIGAGLALVVSITAISALGRFRLSEIVDDEMLERIFEALSNEQMVSTMSAHGKSWRKDRQEITVRQQKDSKLLSLEWIANWLGGKRAFNLWIVIFLLTSVCCLFIIGSTFFFPELFG